MSKSNKAKSPSTAVPEKAVQIEVTKKPSLITSTPEEAANAIVNVNGALLQTAFGSEDQGFCDGLLQQVLQMTADKGVIDHKTLHFVGGALTEINPRNGIEAMLASQIVANHLLAMKMARLAITTTGLEVTERYEAMATKMMRTTTTQLEALHKLRNGGKQKVKVEHIHIHEGAQAVIGDVTTGGR